MATRKTFMTQLNNIMAPNSFSHFCLQEVRASHYIWTYLQIYVRLNSLAIFIRELHLSSYEIGLVKQKSQIHAYHKV